MTGYTKGSLEHDFGQYLHQNPELIWLLVAVLVLVVVIFPPPRNP